MAMMFPEGEKMTLLEVLHAAKYFVAKHSKPNSLYIVKVKGEFFAVEGYYVTEHTKKLFLVTRTMNAEIKVRRFK